MSDGSEHSDERTRETPAAVRPPAESEGATAAAAEKDTEKKEEEEAKEVQEEDNVTAPKMVTLAPQTEVCGPHTRERKGGGGGTSQRVG